MKKPTILALVIAIIAIVASLLFGMWYFKKANQSVNYNGRTYIVSTLSPLTQLEVEQKLGKTISYKTKVPIGEVWANEGGCDIQPCTQTVIFIKQKDGKFQDYTLSGGP